MKGKRLHFVSMILLTLAIFVTFYRYRHFIFNNGYLCKVNEQKSLTAPTDFNMKRTNLSLKPLESLDKTAENKCKVSAL